MDERRRQVQHQVEIRLHGLRCDHPDNGRDDLDASDDATRHDLERALIQMGAEALSRIDEAIVRFDDGDCGRCVACDGDIAEERLRALPFAIRCRVCEQAHEDEPERARSLTQRPGSVGHFSHTIRS